MKRPDVAIMSLDCSCDRYNHHTLDMPEARQLRDYIKYLEEKKTDFFKLSFKNLSDHLKNVTGVISIGLGDDEFYVYCSTKNVTKGIPTSFEGWLVKAEVVGSIKPAGNI